MSEHDDETKQFLPTPAPDDPTMLTPPVSSSGQSAPGAPTVAFTPSVGSGVSRPVSTSGGSSRSAAPPAPGIRRIGDYDLESEIARGGMGIVYKARQLSLNRPVAFKMILAGQFASTADVERFHVEAEAAAGLDHPNIVPIYEVGSFEGNHFFTMKLVDGRSMAHEMPRLVQSPRDGVRLLVKVCRAIHYAHQHSILHRDLKPANILLDAQGEPHVTDFGLAKRTGGDSQLTQTGTIVGTPSYMAPEQAAPSKIPLTTAADVYSLGAMLYEILTGRPPFKGDSPLDTLMLVIHKDAERPRSINASADRDLETIALKCLEKDPARRYGSAEALAEDLDRWLDGEPILARPIGSTERVVKWAKRRPAIAALAVGIATVTVLGIAGVIWQWREAVYQRGQTASALIQVAQEAKAAEAARDQEAAQRTAAESARQQETIARTAADEQKAIAVGALASAQRSNYFNDISLADFEWASNNIPHVDQLLGAAPASMRGWEWHYLSRLAHMETSFVAVGPKLTAMAIDESGAQAVAITSDLKATRVDLRAHRVVRSVALDGAVGTDIGALSLSADGSRFAAVIIQIDHGQIRQTTTVWDTGTGRALMRQSGQGLRFYNALTLTSDGRRLFTAMLTVSDGANETAAAGLAALTSGSSTRSQIQVWDTSTGTELASPGFAAGSVTSFSFSPDARTVAVSSTVLNTDVDVSLLDAVSLKVLGVLKKSGDARSVFSADGHRVARGSTAGVGVWSATGGDPLWSWKGDATNVVAFSPSGRYLAAALVDRSIQIFDAATGTPGMRLFGDTSTVAGLRFVGSDSGLAAADADGVRMFAIAEPAPPLVVDGPAEMMMAAGVTPDRRRLVGLVRGALEAWDLETGRLLYGPAPMQGASPAGPVSVTTPQMAQSIAASTGQLTSVGGRVLFSADGRRTVLARSSLVAVGETKQMRPGLRLFDTTTGKELQAFEPAAEKAPSVTAPKGMSTAVPMGMGLDAAGVHAAVSTMKMSVSLGTASSSASGAQGGVPAMSFVGSDVLVWAGTNSQPRTAITLTDAMAAAAHLSPDGRYLVILSASLANDSQEPPRYRVYDAATGRQLGTFAADRQSAPVAFSADSRLIAAETARHTVTIWDPAHPSSPRVLPQNRTAVTAIAFSPDGSRLATASDQGITLFDTVSGMPLLVLRESKGPFSSREIVLPGRLLQSASALAFSADGRQILLTTIVNDPKGIRVTLKTWEGRAK